MKKCMVCKRLFKPNSGSQKYCSKLCKQCVRKSQHKKAYKKYYNSPLGLYNSLKKHAEERDVKFYLNKEMFITWYNKQNKKCIYCERTETEAIKDKIGPFKRITIDRKDNDIGYKFTNLVLACYRCNSIKGSFLTFKEMKQVAKIIKRRR
jgi:hypothetical protein